jgi:DNA-binding winged helix-turn-helix (wHTH) protein
MRYVFNDLSLDLATRQLLRRGRVRHLEPKAFDLLALLLSRRPQAIAKGEIQERLWPGTFVTESSLTSLVTQIRQALGDDSRRPRYIRTIHAFGYAFSGEATEENAAPAAPPASAPPVRPRRPFAQVIWDERAFVLAEGENVLGRDENASVQLDWPGVSRKHARIVLTGDKATIEDLGSKNGTFLREEKVAAPTPLADGDAFRLGRLLLEFRIVRGAVSTRTEIVE